MKTVNSSNGCLNTCNSVDFSVLMYSFTFESHHHSLKQNSIVKIANKPS
jgi:hypothetical protein